jgi:hypothetical protein
MALVWERRQPADTVKNFFAHTPRGKRIVLSDEFPDFGDVLRCARVKLKTPVSRHFVERCLSSSSSRCRKLSKNVSPSMGFTRPLLMSS